MAWELWAIGCTIDDTIDLFKQNWPSVRANYGTVYYDLKDKQRQIAKSFNNYVDDLPIQHYLSCTHLEMIKKQAWHVFSKSTDENIKLRALNTALNAEIELNKVRGDPDYIIKLRELKSASIRSSNQKQERQGVAD